MSQYRSGGVDYTFIAGEDLRSARYHAVAFTDTDDEVALAIDATNPAGIIQNAPDKGEQALVRISGASKAYVSGDVDPGEFLTANQYGELVVTDNHGDIYIAGSLHPSKGLHVVEVSVVSGMIA